MKNIFALIVMSGLFAGATTSYAGGYSATFDCSRFQLVRHVNDYNYETPTFDELIDSSGNQIAYSDKRSSDFSVVAQGGQVMVKMRGQTYSCSNVTSSPNNSGE